MLGCRASSGLAKLINSYTVLLSCCLGQLWFREGADTSPPGWDQPKAPGYAGSQMCSPNFAFPALWTRGMQLEGYTDPPAWTQDRGPELLLGWLAQENSWGFIEWVLGPQCFLLCLCWFCSSCLISAPTFAVPAWLDQGCSVSAQIQTICPITHVKWDSHTLWGSP